jgi:Flp pilus assembly pilin Flp
MNPIIPLYVTITTFVQGRVEKFREDRGASAVEYGALIILAAAIIGALWASGVVTTLGSKTKTAVDSLFSGGGGGSTN